MENLRFPEELAATYSFPNWSLGSRYVNWSLGSRYVSWSLGSRYVNR
ncbi:MAG: hypothetical protein IAE90_14345 [Ignavibacteria bacterium]|nr:hypothetical protein [Ignavibacteria bacterium]